MATHRLPFLLLLLHGLFVSSLAAPLFTEFIYPNFTASSFDYVDTAGAFLHSPTAVFKAAMYNPKSQQSSFYLCVLHAPSGTVVWSANRAAPVSSSSPLLLTPSGLSISPRTPTPAAAPVWSTPALRAPVASLRLLDSGNLLLLDSSNATLWQSFDHPTDTVLSGQLLPVGRVLTSSVSDSDLSEGDYSMAVTASDLSLRWLGDQQYWGLSIDTRSFKNSYLAVARMAVNSSGLFLYSTGGDVVVSVPALPPAELRIARVDSTGRFVIKSFATASATAPLDAGFIAPASSCDLPFTCNALGLCKDGAANCGCPDGFSQTISSACAPSDGSTLAPNCSAVSGSGSPVSSSSRVSFVSLGGGIGYFGTIFGSPTLSRVNLTACQDSCSGNCSCLGFYYSNSSLLCYHLNRRLGSLISKGNGNNGGASSLVGYIKTVPSQSKPSPSSSPTKASVLAVVLPSVALFLLIIVLLLFFIRWRRRRQMVLDKYRLPSKNFNLAGGRPKKSSPRNDSALDGSGALDDDDDISIPGLPTRFTYQDLEAATSGFQSRIGSGGFGEVYKGVLPDGSDVAVKRINNMGVQGKKEFCTEIAIIGKIHHVNLVRLRGFCAQGSRRLLIYEFMNRSSLDRSLFSGRPVLEWQERVDIAIGAARGLAYLHSGCENKIIHCDVKPENILLHDHNGIKIADFGLSKLLSPEQSSHFTTMRGTRGYLAPEWLTNSAISDRTDVYSFGMVLLELVRGRKNCVTSAAAVPADTSSSSIWANGLSSPSSRASAAESYFPLVALEMHEEGRYEELADPRLQGRVAPGEVARVVKIALCCLHEEPGQRPAMGTVVGMLEGAMPVREPRGELLNFLRFYGRGVAERSGDGGAGGVNRGNYAARVGGNGTASVVSSGSSSTAASMSYLSSQEVSGPR